MIILNLLKLAVVLGDVATKTPLSFATDANEIVKYSKTYERQTL